MLCGEPGPYMGAECWRFWFPVSCCSCRSVSLKLPLSQLQSELNFVVFGLIDITCNSYDGATPLPGAAAICPHGALIDWAFSVTTNVSCTILIGFKAWCVRRLSNENVLNRTPRQHRRMMRELDPHGNGTRMSSEKILSLLVESGSLYSLLWVGLNEKLRPIFR